MYRLGLLVDMLVTHANTMGFGLTSLSGVHRGFMPPQLKTNKTRILIYSSKTDRIIYVLKHQRPFLFKQSCQLHNTLLGFQNGRTYFLKLGADT